MLDIREFSTKNKGSHGGKSNRASPRQAKTQPSRKGLRPQAKTQPSRKGLRPQAKTQPSRKGSVTPSNF